MKSKIILSAILSAIILSLTLSLSSCWSGESHEDVGKHAMVLLPNGELIEGEIERFSGWEEGAYEITIDGVTYHVHSSRVAIVESEDSKK